MSFISVDVESDGPIIGRHSLVCFGAVVVEPTLSRTFYGQLKPISDEYVPEALAVSGFTRQQHEQFDEPMMVMQRFAEWLNENSTGRPVFISDNPAFDWQFINWYFHTYCGVNPFDFSARRIGDLYCGMKMDASLNNEWKKKLRRTNHDHNPVNDAMGNAEAILQMKEMGLKIGLK